MAGNVQAKDESTRIQDLAQPIKGLEISCVLLKAEEIVNNLEGACCRRTWAAR